jgi:hypothetical protein
MEFFDETRRINLQIKGSDRVFNLRATNQDSYETWKKKITHSVKSSNGVLKDLTIASYSEDFENSFKFWRFMRINEEAFHQQAETGDILVCSNKSTNIPIIKSIGGNGAEYQDVVAVYVIIKLNVEGDANNLRVIRPGTSEEGVMLDDWDQFKLFKQEKFTDVFFRHIHVDRTTDKFS